VISLANNTTIVGEVCTKLVDFAARWAQSPTCYDVIVATTFDAEWAKAHRPVISSTRQGHVLYTRFRLEQPLGQLVLCPGRCPEGVRSKTQNDNLRFICIGCNLRCTIHKSIGQLDKSTALGRATFVKTAFPQALYSGTMEWKKQDIKPAPQDTGRHPPSATTPFVPPPTKVRRRQEFPSVDLSSGSSSLPAATTTVTRSSPSSAHFLTSSQSFPVEPGTRPSLDTSRTTTYKKRKKE
jgi:hypothetical protein